MGTTGRALTGEMHGSSSELARRGSFAKNKLRDHAPAPFAVLLMASRVGTIHGETHSSSSCHPRLRLGSILFMAEPVTLENLFASPAFSAEDPLSCV